MPNVSFHDAFYEKGYRDTQDSVQERARDRYILGDFAQNHIRGCIQLLKMLQDDIATATKCGFEDWDPLECDEIDTALRELQKLLRKPKPEQAANALMDATFKALGGGAE